MLNSSFFPLTPFLFSNNNVPENYLSRKALFVVEITKFLSLPSLLR